MPNTSDRRKKQARKMIKEIHKLNGAVKGAAQEQLRQVRQNGIERYENGRGKLHQAERGLVRFIRHRPLRSALIAAGVGAVFGGLWLSRLTLARAHTK